MRISDWSSYVCSSDLLAAARVVIDGDGHRPSSSSMPCCWPQEGAAGSRSSRAPRKLPLTNFQASWGQSATMLKHLAIFLCYAGGAAALAFYGPQWRSEQHTSELQSLMRTSSACFCL